MAAEIANAIAGYFNGAAAGYRWNAIAIGDRVLLAASFVLVGYLSVKSQEYAREAGLSTGRMRQVAVGKGAARGDRKRARDAESRVGAPRDCARIGRLAGSVDRDAGRAGDGIRRTADLHDSLRRPRRRRRAPRAVHGACDARRARRRLRRPNRGDAQRSARAFDARCSGSYRSVGYDRRHRRQRRTRADRNDERQAVRSRRPHDAPRLRAAGRDGARTGEALHAVRRAQRRERAAEKRVSRPRRRDPRHRVRSGARSADAHGGGPRHDEPGARRIVRRASRALPRGSQNGASRQRRSAPHRGDAAAGRALRSWRDVEPARADRLRRAGRNASSPSCGPLPRSKASTPASKPGRGRWRSEAIRTRSAAPSPTCWPMPSTRRRAAATRPSASRSARPPRSRSSSRTTATGCPKRAARRSSSVSAAAIRALVPDSASTSSVASPKSMAAV